MKKVERSIYIVIIIILVAVISSGATYIILNNNKPNETTKENNNVDNNENDNNQENDDKENNKEEQITLSDSELEEYLSYIPNVYIEDKGIAYTYKYSDKTSIDNFYLLGTALKKLALKCFENNNCYVDKTLYYPDGESSMNGYYAYNKSDADVLMKKMYNINNYEINSIFPEYVASDGGLCYYYKDNEFISTDCATSGSHFSNITNYSVSTNELIIYEVVADYDNYQSIITDYYTDKEINLNIAINNNEAYDKAVIEMEKYFKEHQTEFTKYKHTYKKNDSGYYWYSTEVVES